MSQTPGNAKPLHSDVRLEEHQAASA
jgi:hypothetical protein